MWAGNSGDKSHAVQTLRVGRAAPNFAPAFGLRVLEHRFGPPGHEVTAWDGGHFHFGIRVKPKFDSTRRRGGNRVGDVKPDGPNDDLPPSMQPSATLSKFVFISVAAIIVGLVLMAFNFVRYAGDGALGTNAHVNLSNWSDHLDKIRTENIRAAEIGPAELPRVISPQQVVSMFQGLYGIPNPPLTLPHFEDPWGHPLQFELLSDTPRPQWRVTTRVGRTFFGVWIIAQHKVEGPDTETGGKILSTNSQPSSK